MSQTITGTTYKIGFDFTTVDQRNNLDYLQNNNYQLLAYKGASGPNQVTAGIPVWFAEPFANMFGTVEIDYEPLYKVYVYNSAVIGEDTTIKMQILSDAIGLGTELIFNQDGSFTTGPTPVSAGSIMVKNNTAATTPNVTIGLAALINGQYLPFCAFTSTPQGAISMTPHETVCIFAAQTSLKSGSVTAAAASPGCSFSFSAAEQQFELAIADGTYQVVSALGGNDVESVDSGADLTELLN